jgi:hypothetical protein
MPAADPFQKREAFPPMVCGVSQICEAVKTKQKSVRVSGIPPAIITQATENSRFFTGGAGVRH